MSSAAQVLKVKRMILAGSIGAITMTGVWYGAGLKTQSQMKEEVQKRREATPAEKIAMLEQQKGALISKRIGIENKIKKVEMRLNGATREESLQGQERKR